MLELAIVTNMSIINIDRFSVAISGHYLKIYGCGENATTDGYAMLDESEIKEFVEDIDYFIRNLGPVREKVLKLADRI